jgi:CBS domain-containing protein
MKTLRQLLADKQQTLAVVSPKDTVFHALKLMADHNVGAVLVLDGEQLVGLLSERDYARKIVLQGKSSKDATVQDIMSDKVLYVSLEHSIDQCMAIMSEKRFRHLPVLDAEQQLIGIVSIGDLVKETICEQQFIIHQLENYING